MLKSIVKKNSIKMSFSFLMGAMLALTIASKENKDIIDLAQIRDNEVTYADLNIDIVSDFNHPDHPDIIEALCIRKNDYPFIFMGKDSSNKIVSWGITDGKEGLIALSQFDKDRISQFSIYGNQVHDENRMPVFSFKASDKPGVWQKVQYMPLSKTIVENGKLSHYEPIGELYNDLDFDGQFDAKRVLNEESEIVFFYIFINGKWLLLDNKGLKEKRTKIGYYNPDKLEAVTFDGKYKINYEFEIGKGWKMRSKTRARVRKK
ncbi:MAG: hypothetical protein GY774_02530 [Planctomycetes bacterium]|nr:hypothetical protein [Planctomycetota bacterium]